MLTLSALTSHDKDLLGKSKDFKAFHISFSLPMNSFSFFSKKTFFLIKISLCTLYRTRHNKNSLSICNLFVNVLIKLSLFCCFRNFTNKPFVEIMFYRSFFNRCDLINNTHNFLNEVIMGLNSIIEILVARKIYNS